LADTISSPTAPLDEGETNAGVDHRYGRRDNMNLVWLDSGGFYHVASFGNRKDKVVMINTLRRTSTPSTRLLFNP